MNVVNILDYGADPTGNSDSTGAIQSAFDAAVSGDVKTVYIPNGNYSIYDSLLVEGSINIVGDGKEYSKLIWKETSNTGNEDLIYLSNGSRTDNFTWSDFRVQNAPRDGIHIVDVHQWVIQNIIADQCGRHGFYHEKSWKGIFIACMSNQNDQNGFHAGSESQTTNVLNCWALSNGNCGVVAAVESFVHGCTLESNEYCGIYVGSAGVNVAGNYFEGKGNYSDPSAGNVYHILVEDTNGVHISGQDALKNIDIGLMIRSSRNIQLSGLTGRQAGGALGSYGWDKYGNVGVWITEDCEDIVVGAIESVPMVIEDLSKVYFLRDRKPDQDVLDGYGFFNEEGSYPGIAENWIPDVDKGVGEAQLLPSNTEAIGEYVQEITMTSTYQGINSTATFKPNTTYTIGIFLKNEIRVFLQDPDNNRIADQDIYPSPYMRFLAFQFTTGGNPTGSIRIRSREGSGTFWVGGVKVVEGAFDMSSFPMPSEHDLGENAYILKSPNGSRFTISVDNNGQLIITGI
ncbi:right-handed parallel beta-helix repeat-containing protein [Cytobacillus sp. IB215665]|uniref:right-handed parallel beta-helix repeat-containing protein n=1 Tax=Cytobacillus sp. IB215665 TaxID=3097357 RepID=UPI002A183E08|nr:glycosyl hydrolase family 28-related protein [Cytobacillus sp. IB215665]MDX8363748.1 glycosyl hydrolase family 28-related protein [Cytobacillus sp. IB215665]